MTVLLDDILFDVPDVDRGEVTLDADDVKSRLRDVVQDTDLRKYIL
jgi:ATP-dependent protease HslVU (ClpYQ) ATPase subunit